MQLTLSSLETIFVFSGYLIIFNELARRSRWFCAFAFIFTPILLLPVFVRSLAKEGPMFGIKFFSLVIPQFWFFYLRYHSKKIAQWQLYVIYSILILNVFEAGLYDLMRNNYLNAATALMLLLSLPGVHSISVDRKNLRDILWDIPVRWIVCYIAWNYAFVLKLFYPASNRHIALLAVPILACLFGLAKRKRFDNRLWIQSRAFTLAGYVIFVLAAQNFVFSNFIMSRESLVSPALYTIVSELAFVLGIYCLANSRLAASLEKRLFSKRRRRVQKKKRA